MSNKSKVVKHYKGKRLPRTIQTTYYGRNGQVIRINKSSHAARAVAKAIEYMELDHYHAKTVEVFDINTGTVHAIITCINFKKIEIIYKRDPRSTQ